LRRQGFERWPIEVLEQLTSGHAEPADRPFFVETLEQLADRRVDLGEAEEGAIA